MRTGSYYVLITSRCPPLTWTRVSAGGGGDCITYRLWQKHHVTAGGLESRETPRFTGMAVLRVTICYRQEFTNSAHLWH